MTSRPLRRPLELCWGCGCRVPAGAGVCDTCLELARADDPPTSTGESAVPLERAAGCAPVDGLGASGTADTLAA